MPASSTIRCSGRRSASASAGVFVEILKDTVTEMAPLSHDDALRMIRRIKAAPILEGARGRDRADIEALAALLVALGQFAVANSGRFRALDLNPIIVGSSGAVAVDIAIEPIGRTRRRHRQCRR